MSTPHERLGADRRSAFLLLALLILGDLMFIVVHIVNRVFIKDPAMSLAFDGGHPEWYQYVKYLWLAALTCGLYSKTRSAGYLSWAALFVFMLVDDAFRVHERLGSVFATAIPDMLLFPGLRAQALGEVAAFGLGAVVIVAWLLATYWRGPASFRTVTRQMFLLLGALAFFAIAVDLVHSMVDGKVANFALATLEDGGEMVVISVMLWYVTAVYLQPSQASDVRVTNLMRWYVANRRPTPRPRTA